MSSDGLFARFEAADAVADVVDADDDDAEVVGVACADIAAGLTIIPEIVDDEDASLSLLFT